MGGAMRQAGIIAAGALYALEHHRQRLKEDHANALELAKHLSNIPGLAVDLSSVQTNIVMIQLKNHSAVRAAELLNAAGVRVLCVGPETLRAVTSLMISSEDITSAV